MTYRSHADLGGREESRRVVPEPDGAQFHAPWEARAMALTVAMGASGLWNIDESRAARETLPDYERLSYYQIWLDALQKLVDERGILREPSPLAPRMLRAADVAGVLKKGAPTLRTSTRAPRFKLKDRIRTIGGDLPHHTRLPHYARDKLGRIERIHGMHVFPDSNAHGGGESPQWLYTVCFESGELFGGEGAREALISIDAFESYLGPA
ncbi:MAG TPA: nitrile hydratase subunit beta [Steroidobacteraceae bacterium]